METYREELEIPTWQWLELLQDSSVFKDDDIALMKALYNCKDCREKASVLAEVLGVSGHSVLNLQIGRLGKRIINKLSSVKFPTREDGTVRYWHIPFWGEDAEVKGQYYWQLRPELKEALEMLFNANKSLEKFEENVLIAEEIPDEKLKDLIEGAKKQITVNAYERNQKARRLCLQKYGYKCCVCGFDFEEFYGDIGIGYIEVHHVKPLNEISKEYIVDPFNDLRPICPNCHSMVHKGNITVENLKDIIKKKRNTSL
ncbi:MAG: HNH endonuclease [Bacillota bacterium]|jgi:5-methylcytosine-specific restriction protein A